MDLSRCRVLVTGAGGFIGSHLVEALVSQGARVRAFVRYTSRADLGALEDAGPEVIDRLEVMPGDFEDPAAALRAVEGMEVVFHLGALIAIPYSYQNPTDVVQANVVGTANILEACRKTEVAKVVLMSTSEVYGSARYVPMDEDHPLTAQSPYAASKIASDKLGESYHLSYGLPVAVARPFNTYGPRQSARAIIPSIITQALTGDRVKLGNTDPRRDFCYVGDTVGGLLRIAAAAESVGQTFNLGTGREISIGDLAQKIIQLSGRQVELESDSRRQRPAASEVNRLLADTTKVRRDLGWQAHQTIEAGLERTMDWIKRHLDRFRPDAYTI